MAPKSAPRSKSEPQPSFIAQPGLDPRTPPRRSLHHAFAAAFTLFIASAALAQTPVVLPNTMSTIEGLTPTATTATTACPTNAQFTAQDALGNGCPAINATVSVDDRSMVVDPAGNIYTISDSNNPQSVRRIDARTGNITIFAGSGGGGCGSGGVTVDGTLYTAVDKTGDGCPAYDTGGFNGGRGLGMDPYGNLIIGVTGDSALHFVCTAVSPLCTASQVRVNLMRAIAGCTTSVTGYGTAVAGTTVGTAGDGGPATQTSLTQYGGTTCTNGIDQNRQAVGDKWGNIFFTDNGNNRIRVVLGVASITVNGSPLANPLYTAEALFTATGTYSALTQGYIYPIAGGGTVCSGKTDAGGDGCPFYQTVVNTGTSVQGLTVTPDGDFLFADGLGRLRIIYLGGTASKAALAANGVSSPQVGYSYALIGNGTGTSGVTGGTNLYYNSTLSGVYLGSLVSLQSGATQRLAADSVGNIYIGDQAQVLFYDIYTGYIRRLGGGTTATVCTGGGTYGDTCPIAQSLFGAANIILSVGLDNLNNLYIQDLQNHFIRRASATTLPTVAVNSSISAPLVVHSPAAASSVAVSGSSNSEFTVGSTTCAAANTDSTVDCTTPVTYAPVNLEQQTDPLTVATTVSSVVTKQSIGLNANSTGSALAFDTANTPSTSTLASALTGNTVVIVDGQGALYTSGTQGISKTVGSTTTNITSTAATYIAVDNSGNVYTASGTGTSITEYIYSATAGTYTSSTITIPATIPISGANTQGHAGPMVVDANGFIYIADTTNLQLYKYQPSTGLAQQLSQTAFTSPSAITADSYGNLLVIDGVKVYKIPAAGLAISTSSPIASPTVTFPTALTAPTSVAVDQGEDVYVTDGGVVKVVSLTGYQYTIPNVSGTSVAIDGSGDLYVTTTSTAGITKVLRNAEAQNFGTDVSDAYVGVFLDTGATASTGFNQTDTGGNYSFLAPTSPIATTAPTCTLTSTVLTGGAICNVSIKFAPTATGSGPVPDVITLLPAANTLGALSLNGLKNGSTATTTTAITGNTAGLIYSSGTETTFTITVTQSTGTPVGQVSVQIDGGTAVNYTLGSSTTSSATASVPVSGLTAGSHSIVANYAGSSGIAGSTSNTVTFSIAQATTSVSWTPGATTQQYSAAIGTSVLDATASVPGVFVYMATPSGGGASEINSASYLSIGTYSLAVTFYPTDSIDYTGSTSSVSTYTVTKATTTATVAATQFLVASDGTGNYTGVQAAINAVGASGGSVYIKPGTYTGDLTVVQPGVSLRGLGGDPTKVILTHASGSFSVNPGSVYNYAGEFNTSYSNGYQLPANSSLFSGDEGSATLVVAKGINTAFSTSTLTPNNFYAENLSLINTYDSDTTTTTTTYVSGGVCTANAGPAMTYNALYNAGTECASQALAIWITGDLAVLNNVYTASLQDTIYAGSQGSGSNGYVPSREYWFRGKVTGDVDYIFGDAAAVFDHSTIYTAYHSTATGTDTIEAQNKAVVTGSSSDYLSGYIMNSNIFTSQSSGMTQLYFGRPYGTYSTWIMLNSAIDQVAPVGYIEFSGDTNLPTSTYAEYNDSLYIDPATNTNDANGVIYVGQGGSSGTGVTGTRETTSQDPGTPMASNTIKTSLTQAQAQAYYPTNFLSKTVSSLLSTTQNWIPTAALAANVNAFVPTGTAAATSVVNGASITILMRPQTPGLGAVSAGAYTIPTGTYTLYDTLNGGSQYVVASGSLDASGEAYFTSSTLSVGTHNLVWNYSGDSNFAASTTASAYVLTVTGATTTTTTTLSNPTTPITYGQPSSVTATVSSTSGTPTGSVTLYLNGVSYSTKALSGGAATFTLTGLTVANYALTASYAGNSTYAASTTTANTTVMVSPATLTVTGSCLARPFDTANTCSVSVSNSYQYSDSAATVFATGPTVTPSALRNSPAGTYNATPVYTLTTFGSTNYTVNPVVGQFSVDGLTPQIVIFPPLPNFTHGTTYQLTARTISGLPVTYTVTAGTSIASVSNATLTVTGTGPVTIQASQSTDPTGDYAAATPISRSFTAQ
jgi:pectin methylesterase-like acyl-CoA thioesterase